MSKALTESPIETPFSAGGCGAAFHDFSIVLMKMHDNITNPLLGEQ